MTLPLLGPMTLSGFSHAWFFVFLLVILGLVALYIIAQVAQVLPGAGFTTWSCWRASRRSGPPGGGTHVGERLVGSLVLFTIAMAGPTHDVRIPRNRAVVMLVIDVSQSSAGHRRRTQPDGRGLSAAAKEFAGELTPGINLGLIAYAGTSTVLVQPTTNRDATKAALDKLQFADRTATGEGIFTALQAIATVGAVDW